jgi:HPt (histidine-containing phosphotransfer) domain-containing protein
MDAVTTKPVTVISLRTAITEGLDAAGRKTETIMAGISDLVEELGEAAVREILASFAEDTNALLQAMREAAARADSVAIYRAAHSVAGAARNVGATALATRASTLEQDIGSLSAARIEAEIAAMQADLDAAVAGLVVARV